MVTTTSTSLTFYAKALNPNYPTGSSASKEITIMVCGGESIAATSPINLIYQVGATESIANADTLF